MHVAQVNYAYDPALRAPEALLERYDTLVGWSEALLEAGCPRVTVFQRFGSSAEVCRNGVDYVFRSDGGPAYPRARTFPRRLHDEIRARVPDLVHVNGLIFPIQTWRLSRALPARTAMIVQDHAGGAPREGATARARAWVWSRCLARVDAFLFTARGQSEPWIDAGIIGDSQDVFEIAESSRPYRRLVDAGRSGARLPGMPALLWVGRLNANKDPLTVIEGFERALPSIPRAALTMAFGEGDLTPAVQARLAASPILANRVHLRGLVPPHELAALYSAADVFVLGSHREGSGYALIEALACGAVPVVTDIPSFRALTDDGRVGALWRPGQPEAFAAALLDVVRQDLDRLRREVTGYFEQRLSWPAIGRRAQAIYRDVLALRAAGEARE